MSRWRFILTVGAAALFIGGCGIFGGEDDELPPAKLLKFDETLKLDKVWSAKVGKGSDLLRLGLAPIGDGLRVYTASYDGNVSAFDPATGKRQWQTELDILLTGGPGIGEDIVVVAGGDGDIVALNAADGAEVWRTNIVGESLSRPLVTSTGVIIYTIDGNLRLLDLYDGDLEWSIQQDLPALTLRGNSSPILIGSTVIAGFDNGRLMAIDIETGNTEWESMISPPSGRSDLERLADVDGRLQSVGQDLYVSGYHGQVQSLAAESGQLLWSRDFSTYVGVGADWNNVYLATDEGELVALQRQNGSDVWRSDALLRRQPTTPVSYDLTVAVGDFDGYVHFFSNIDGRPVARVRVGSGPLSGSPVVIGDQLYIQSESGQLVVYEIPEDVRKSDEPDPDTEET